MDTKKNTWPYPKVIAHRGGGRFAPENTQAAIQLGAKMGHQMIEFDVTLSADDVAFLLHDPDLRRTTNSRQKASKVDWSYLQTLDAGSWFSSQFLGEKIPSLEKVAQLSQQLNLCVNIEIKPAKGAEQHTGALIAQKALQHFSNHPIKPLLSSFSYDALTSAKEAVSELPRGLLAHRWRSDLIERALSLECVSIHLHHSVITPKRIKAIKTAGLSLLAYTVNSFKEAQCLLDLGVDSICTDEIELIHPGLF